MEMINIENRVWEVVQAEKQYPKTSADLLSRGFDGIQYTGISIANGKQRKNYCANFFKTMTGKYVIVNQIVLR